MPRIEELPESLKQFCNEEGILSENKLYDARTFRCSTCPIAKAIKFIKNSGKVALGGAITLNMCNVVDYDKCIMDDEEIVEFEP